MKALLSRTYDLYRDPHTNEFVSIGFPVIAFAAACMVILPDWWTRLIAAIIMLGFVLVTVLGVDAGARLCVLETSNRMNMMQQEAMDAIAAHIFGEDLPPVEEVSEAKFAAPPSDTLH